MSPSPLRVFRGDGSIDRTERPQLTLRSLVMEDYFPHRLQGRSALTRMDYLGTVAKCDRLCDLLERSPALISHLCDPFVEKLVGWLLQAGEWSQTVFQRRAIGNSTINKQLCNLRAFARFADERGLWPYSLTIADLPEADRKLQAWTREEVGRLIDAAQRIENPRWRRATTVPDGLNLTAIVFIIYETGVRISALMSAERWQFDAANGILRVPGEDQKDWEDLLRPLSSPACEVLAQIDRLAAGRQKLIHWQFDPGGPPWKCLRDALRRALVLAGLPTTRHDQFHRLRRTFATYTAIDLGIERTRELLGHSSIETTRGYIDWTIYHELRQPFRMPPPIFNPTTQRELF